MRINRGSGFYSSRFCCLHISSGVFSLRTICENIIAIGLMINKSLCIYTMKIPLHSLDYQTAGMKIFFTFCLQIAVTVSFSQAIFPSLSPKGSIEQTVGFTNISVDYERPAARRRKVFGGLVHYDKLWRTGAGNCTRIRFSKSVVIDNRNINKVTYSIFSVRGKNVGTIILNRDTTLYGINSYDAAKDIVRFKVKPISTARYYESLTIDIDVIPNDAVVYISWENTQVSFPVKTESDKVVSDFVQQQLLTGKSKDSDAYATAAEYYYFLNKDLDRALVLIDKAIAIKNESWYYRQKVDILELQKKYKEAIDVATLAISQDQKRTDWDTESKQQSEAEYKKRIDFYRSQLKN